jgi:hypothetical protein
MRMGVLLGVLMMMGCGPPEEAPFVGTFSGTLVDDSACGDGHVLQAVAFHIEASQIGDRATADSPQLPCAQCPSPACPLHLAVSGAVGNVVPEQCPPWSAPNVATITFSYDSGMVARSADGLSVDVLVGVASVFHDGSTSACTKNYQGDLLAN